jgi:hypothetical protein
MMTMALFESALFLVLVAIALLQVSRRLTIPYLTMLALAGVPLSRKDWLSRGAACGDWSPRRPRWRFPNLSRLIVLSALTVVLGTLVLRRLTLGQRVGLGLIAASFFFLGAAQFTHCRGWRRRIRPRTWRGVVNPELT